MSQGFKPVSGSAGSLFPSLRFWVRMLSSRPPTDEGHSRGCAVHTAGEGHPFGDDDLPRHCLFSVAALRGMFSDCTRIAPWWKLHVPRHQECLLEPYSLKVPVCKSRGRCEKTFKVANGFCNCTSAVWHHVSETVPVMDSYWAGRSITRGLQKDKLHEVFWKKLPEAGGTFSLQNRQWSWNHLESSEMD